jgi:pyruvate-formate lyase
VNHGLVRLHEELRILSDIRRAGLLDKDVDAAGRQVILAQLQVEIRETLEAITLLEAALKPKRRTYSCS